MKVAPIVNKKGNWFTQIMNCDDFDGYQRKTFTIEKKSDLVKIAIYNPENIFSAGLNSINRSNVEDDLPLIGLIKYKLLKRKYKDSLFINPEVNLYYSNEGLQISNISHSLAELSQEIPQDKPEVLLVHENEVNNNYGFFSELKMKHNLKIISVSEETRKESKGLLIDSSIIMSPLFGCSETDIKRAYEQIGSSVSEKEGLYSKLQEIYPEVDEKFLYETANKIGDSIKDLGEKIDVTGSEVVLPIVNNEGVDYFKASTKHSVIVKESEWINLAKQNYLTRIANASMKGYIKSKNYSGIITKGTQNEFDENELKDFRKYLTTKENILTKYAQANNLDTTKLLLDPVVASVFNTVINHVFIGSNVDNKILAKSYNARVKDFEELEQRAKHTSDKYSLRDFRELKNIYDLTLKKFNDQEDVGSELIIHGDNRPGNLGIEQPNTPYCLGRKIDFGAARLGYVSEDLSKLETLNNGAFVPLYNHIIRELNKEAKVLDTDSLKDRVNNESLVNEVRALSFALSKDNFENAERYFNLINQKSKIYKVA